MKAGFWGWRGDGGRGALGPGGQIIRCIAFVNYSFEVERGGKSPWLPSVSELEQIACRVSYF